MKKCNDLINDIKIDLFLDKLLEAVKFTSILNSKIEDSELKENFLLKLFIIYNFSSDDAFETYDFENITGTNDEIYNEYINAMSLVDYKISKEKYTDDFFKELHLKLFKNSRFVKTGCLIGEYKNYPNSNEIQEEMDDLIHFMNDDNLKIHDLVKCAMFYYQFHMIKPFEKGNEKLARYLITVYLYKANIFCLPIFGLSYILSSEKVKYLDILENFQKIDINDWIIYFLDKCIEQAKFFIELIKDFIGYYKMCKKLLDHRYDAFISDKLMDVIFGKFCFTSNELAESMNTSNTQANRYLKFLVRIGILATDTKQRYKKYYLVGFGGIFKYW